MPGGFERGDLCGARILVVGVAADEELEHAPGYFAAAGEVGEPQFTHHRRDPISPEQAKINSGAALVEELPRLDGDRVSERGALEPGHHVVREPLRLAGRVDAGGRDVHEVFAAP